MKKKLFTLLTLLVMSVTGAWASTEVINAGTWASNALYSGTCVYTSNISGAGDGQFSAGDGGGNIKNYSPSNKGIKLRTQRALVTISETEYGFVLFSVQSGYKVNSITIEGTSNGSDNTVTLKGVYADVNTASLAASLAGATNILTEDKIYPNSGTNYITSGSLSVNAENNILLLFDKTGGNQLRAIITFDYDISGTIAPTITQSGNTVTLTSATDGANIYYTTDGSAPTSASTSYSTPFNLDNPCTVRAIAIKDEDVSGVTDKDCYFTPSGALALLKFTSGEIDGEDAYLWTSTDGDYTLRDNNTAQTNKYTSLEAGNDAFKLSHVDGYTLTPSSDIKITKIAFIGKSLYEGYTGTVKVTGFNSDVASSFITYPAEGQKYLSTIEFTPDDELGYGSAVNFNPGGCESAAYIVIYGVKRSGPAAPQPGAGDPITWDFTGYSSKVTFTNGSSYSYKADDSSTEMRYTAGSSDEITANSYLKENGTSGNASCKDIDGETAIAKTRLIRLFVTGKGSLRINCTSNIGVYNIYEGNATNTAASGSALITGYTANNTSSTLNVTNGLWIETTTKGYITSIVWTPISDYIILTTTDNMDGWRAFNPDGQGYTLDENTTAYIVEAAPTENTVTLVKTSNDGKDVYPNTPVILYTTSAADSHKMTLTASDAIADYAGAGNLLKVTTAAEAITNKYRLGYKSGAGNGVGFYPYSTASAAAGIVYLDASSSGSSKVSIIFEDDMTTAIDNLTISQFDKNAQMYNLSGQKVSGSYKGIVIVNGKKMIRK